MPLQKIVIKIISGMGLRNPNGALTRKKKTVKVMNKVIMKKKLKLNIEIKKEKLIINL
jgi:hypothetical protein